jgi:hypothetical protein
LTRSQKHGIGKFQAPRLGKNGTRLEEDDEDDLYGTCFSASSTLAVLADAAHLNESQLLPSKLKEKKVYEAAPSEAELLDNDDKVEGPLGNHRAFRCRIRNSKARSYRDFI